ncbi:MAG: nucleotidyltransferase domain-containing protein [Polyangia bacterium]|jgi:predicted nucleotidyltransferase|nr:nucleotidyltransferase domain-containing protein [Polyangia bacterium]
MSVDAMIEHLRERARARERARESCRAELRAQLPALVRVLTDGHGARRVFLFGSLAWGEVDEQSDIDLAVEGLAPDRLAAAHGELMLLAVCPVDLVRIESLSEAFRRRIEDEGEVLHDGTAG